MLKSASLDLEVSAGPAANIKEVEQTLLSYGLQVDLASDGQQCIEALKHADYDLVFIDLHMPNIDGFEACSIIRLTNPDIPIVALTAAVLKDEVQKALDAGMNSHLAKPLDHDQLDKVLNRYLMSKGNP
ncbi:response regulator [Paraglaciecola sp. MB-3u-78]|jgi:CheY-like chemotaxis protein|uniref:response regulator n=1 Tax=Paraglaciecola sp. MB-3u-78 TaxID=2058332 RepID=UPI001E3968F4|nr:response regulator [Paraglaciecola sp. MB-3u-78]